MGTTPKKTYSWDTPSKKSSGSSSLGRFFTKAALYGVLAGAAYSPFYNRFQTETTVQVQVTSVTGADAKTKTPALIYGSDGELYRNENTLLSGKSDNKTKAIQSTFKVGGKYNITVYGTNLPGLSRIFGEKNIIKAELIQPAAPAKQPVKAPEQVKVPVVVQAPAAPIDSAAIAAAVIAKQQAATTAAAATVTEQTVTTPVTAPVATVPVVDKTPKAPAPK